MQEKALGDNYKEPLDLVIPSFCKVAKLGTVKFLGVGV